MNFLTLHATICLVYICHFCTCLDITFTIDVAPGVRECLHQYIAADAEYEAEYQVIILQ